MKVPPQDRADFERLLTLVERMDPRNPTQAKAREHILSKLRRYQVDPTVRQSAEPMGEVPITVAHMIARARCNSLAAVQRA
jgi:hypothetical protein